MTSNEMQYEFNVLYDKISSAGSPGYTDKEVGVLLTKAQQTYLQEIFDPYKSFEETEKLDGSLISSANFCIDNLPGCDKS